MKWAYGVRTVLQSDRVRVDQYLPRTLKSLWHAGFRHPWLFVDGAMDDTNYTHFGLLTVTTRWPALGVTGNFVLSLWELMLRFPDADRYILFEDDLICCRNIRPYLDRLSYRPQSYWNLYTCPYYQTACPPWRQGSGREGFYRTPHKGKGALALVFDRTAAVTLMSSQWLAQRLLEAPGEDPIDGLIATAMHKAGFREWAHTPSLVQHVGEVSSFGNGPHPIATSFQGEEFNALDLV